MREGGRGREGGREGGREEYWPPEMRAQLTMQCSSSILSESTRCARNDKSLVEEMIRAWSYLPYLPAPNPKIYPCKAARSKGRVAVAGAAGQKGLIGEWKTS